MANDIDDDIGECWMEISLVNGVSAPSINNCKTISTFGQHGQNFKIYGLISEVFEYFNGLDEMHLKSACCRVYLKPSWIQKKLEVVLSKINITYSNNTFYGPLDLNFDEVENFTKQVEFALRNPSKVSKINNTNWPSSVAQIIKLEEIILDENEIYSFFLNDYFQLNSSHLFSVHEINSIKGIKTFMNRLDNLKCDAPSRLHNDVVDVDENIWSYILKHEPEKIPQIISKFDCSLKTITGSNKKTQLIISSKDSSAVDKVMNIIINLYQEYTKHGMITEQITIKKPQDFELAQKFVNEKRMFGSCYFNICGPKKELNDFKIQFKSHENVKDTINSEIKSLPDNEVRIKHVCSPALTIFISKGNLIHQNLDAIVNPANSQLRHGGGAARAISDAAGQILNDECREYVRKNNSLPQGEVMHTSAGNLRPNIQYVIHTVGPQGSYNKDAHSPLMKTFYNCFMYANDVLSVQSIAVPAISSGIYGVPLDVVGESMFAALDNFLEQRRVEVLKEIHFVNFDDHTVSKLCDAFKKWTQGSNVDRNISDRNISDRSLSDRNISDRHSNHHDIQLLNNDSFHGENMKTLNKMISKEDDFSKLHEISNKNDMTENHHKVHSSNYRTQAQNNEPTNSTETNNLKPDEDGCAICMETIQSPERLKCGHIFCGGCLAEYNKKCNPKCPTCGMIYGEMRGNQPDGIMHVNTANRSLPGYERYGTLEITYQFKNGIQNETHQNPGMPYNGTQRSAYLPNNNEGKEVASMLRKAFDNRILFTIGRSHTTGKNDVVIWNDVHHKTSIAGSYGYPDPGYLKRVTEELAAKGIFPKNTKK